MAAYYNEIEPYAAQWLRNLIAAGHIAPGDVDERSIKDVNAADLQGYTQCHFFAGIGGWSLALRLAGWSDSRPVWTGSCPCQPFSVAGKQKGQTDKRHLWPAWFNLIKSVKPTILFGEQVAGAIAYGWLDDAFDDLEGQGYETAAVVLPACSVGAPHKRDRLWFVGNAKYNGWNGSAEQKSDGTAIQQCEERADDASKFERASTSRSLADADDKRLERRQLLQKCSGQQSPWQAGMESLKCSDGKQRPVKSGICLLADGVPARVGRLRAYGNAIVPAVAAEFIKATM